MRKIKYLLLILLLICLPVKIMADDVINGTATDAATPTGPNDPGNPGGEGGNIGGLTPGIHSGCDVNITTKKEYSLNFDIYDSEGNKLGNPYDKTFKNHKFTAGRFIGIDAYEETRITKTAIGYPYCFEVLRICNAARLECTNISTMSYNEGTGQNSNVRRLVQTGDDCHWVLTGWTYEAAECPTGLDTGQLSQQHPCAGPSQEQCDIEAQNKLKNVTANEIENATHYTAVRYDVNDINAKNSKGTTQTAVITPYETSGVSDVEPVPGEEHKFRISAWKKVKYNLQQACINYRTGKISYVPFMTDSSGKLLYDETAQYCITDKGALPGNRINNSDGEPVGQYFIPLNAKNTSEFVYTLNSKEMETNGKLCQNIIDNYNEDKRWRQLLLGPKKQSLASLTAEKAKDVVKNGCYYVLKVSFKGQIEQSFYNYMTNNNTESLVGYNIYYQPIDVNNPFPSGVDKKSLWSGGIYDRKKNSVYVTYPDGKIKQVDLSKSFDTKTYTTVPLTSSLASEINQNIYTSWSGINRNGTSKSINSGSIIKRNVSIKNIYNLGCGPSNNDWEGCKK